MILKRALRTPPRGKEKLKQLMSSHLDNRQHVELERLSSQIRYIHIIRAARFSYLFLAFYVSTTELLCPAFIAYYDPNVNSLMSSEAIRSLLYCSWLIKPVYGFLGDYIFPFYFRIKGYVVILAAAAIVSSIYVLFQVKFIDSDKGIVHMLLGVQTFVFFTMAFIDSICRNRYLKIEGMTSMTVKLEKRLSKLNQNLSSLDAPRGKNWQAEHLSIKHYLSYTVVRILTRPVFALIANGLVEYAKSKGEPRCFALRWSQLTFCFLSLLVILHFAVFTKELKVAHLNTARVVVL